MNALPTWLPLLHDILLARGPMRLDARAYVAAQIGLALAFAACSGRESSAQSATPYKLTVELDGMRVVTQFPPDWHMVPQQSEPAAGLVAFLPAQQAAPDHTASLFLDGSRSVTLPTSAAEAIAAVRADDVCKGPTDCTELGHSALPGNGWLVSVKKPHAIYTEVWRQNAQHRAVRCGAEISDLAASSTSVPRRWLDDAAAVRKAQLVCEALCRTVVPLP